MFNNAECIKSLGDSFIAGNKYIVHGKRENEIYVQTEKWDCMQLDEKTYYEHFKEPKYKL